MNTSTTQARRLGATTALAASLVLGSSVADDTAPLGGRSAAQPAAAAVIITEGTAALSTTARLPAWPAAFADDTAPACTGGHWYWRAGVGAPPACGDDRRIPAAALRCIAARPDLARDGFAVLVGVAQLDAPWRGAGTRWGAPTAGHAGELACAADLAELSRPIPLVAPLTQAGWSTARADSGYALDFTAAPFDAVVTVFHPAFVAAWHGTWTDRPAGEAAARAAAALTPVRADALNWALQHDHPGGGTANGAWVAFAAQPPSALPAAWAARRAQQQAAPADGPSPHGEAFVEALRLLRGDVAVPGPARQAAPGLPAPMAPGSRSTADSTRYRSPLDAPCRHAVLATFAAGDATADEAFAADLSALPMPRPSCPDFNLCIDPLRDWLAAGITVDGDSGPRRVRWAHLTANTREGAATWPLTASGERASHLDIPALADLGPSHHLQAVVPWGGTALAVTVQPSPQWQWSGAILAAQAASDGTTVRWVDAAGNALTDAAGHLATAAAPTSVTAFTRGLPVADGSLPGGPWWFVGTTAGTLDAYAGAAPARRWSWLPPGAVAERTPRWADHRARGLDGDPLRVDVAGRKLVVTGSGRGNIGYHAVDVSDPATPRTAWSFTAADWPADGPAAPGESTAAPARARIALPGSGLRDVLVVPGGEDPTLRSGRLQASADRAGAALHVLDAATGQRLWTWAADAAADMLVPGLRFSLVATPRVLDEDRDGVADWLLLVDAWGTVSLVDVRPAVAAADWGTWRGVAQLSPGADARAAFHLAPAVVPLPTAARAPASWLVVIGTGHSPDLTVGSTGTLHAWRLTPQRPASLALADLVEIGPDGRALAGGAIAATAPGWRMTLAGDREQVTATPRISGGELLVVTWQPPATPEDAACQRQPGLARLRTWRLPAPPRGAERVVYPEDPREHELPGAVPARQAMPWIPPAAATAACTGEACAPRRYVIAGGRLVALGPLPPARRTVWRALEVVAP